MKDVAAHLLDSDVRRLSYQRDKAPMAPPESPVESYRDLVDFLNRLNADWIKAARRISPRLLIEFLEVTGAQVCEVGRSTPRPRCSASRGRVSENHRTGSTSRANTPRNGIISSRSATPSARRR